MVLDLVPERFHLGVHSGSVVTSFGCDLLVKIGNLSLLPLDLILEFLNRLLARSETVLMEETHIDHLHLGFRLRQLLLRVLLRQLQRDDLVKVFLRFGLELGDILVKFRDFGLLSVVLRREGVPCASRSPLLPA